MVDHTDNPQTEEPQEAVPQTAQKPKEAQVEINATQDPYSRVPDFILRFSPGWRKDLSSLLILLALLITVRWQVFVSFNSKVFGGFLGDGGLYLWLSRLSFSDISSGGWFNTPAFYPYTRTLAYSDNFILPSLVTSTLSAIGFTDTGAYNLVLLVAVLLNGYLTFRLSFLLSGKWWPSVIAGGSFMIIAPMTAQTGHPQLLFFFFIPLGLYALFSFAAQPKFIWGFVFGLTLLSSFLTTVYYSIFIVIIGGWFWLSLWVLRPYQFYLKTYLLFLLSSLLGFLPVLPFLIPYLEVSSVFGERGIYEAYAFAASGWSYLSVPPHTLLYPFLEGKSHPEALLFPGFALLSLAGLSFFRAWGSKTFRNQKTLFILCLALALIFADRDLLKPYMEDQRLASTIANSLCAVFSWAGLGLLVLLLRSLRKTESKLGFHILTNRSIIALLISIAALFIFLSFGPLGNPERGQYALGPYRLLYEVLPGADALRAISRSGLVAIFIASLLSAFALPLYERRFKRPSLALGVIAIVIFLENYISHYPLQDLPARPHVYNILGDLQRSEPGAAIVLPFARTLTHHGEIQSWSEFARDSVSYMNWSLESKAPIINGYSGQRTQIMRQFPRAMKDFPDLRAAIALGALANVRYVVNHTSSYESFDQLEYLAREELHFHNFEKVYEDDDGDILYRYHPPQTRLTQDFELRVPGYPDGFLELELMALYQPDTPEYDLEIIEVDQLGSNTIARLRLEANGEWQFFSIPLPSAIQRARPYRISFIPQEEVDVFLRKRSHFYQAN